MSKKFVRAFALVLVVLMCLSLLPLAARADEGHVCTFEPTTIPPTCGTNGYVQMICPVCGNGGEIISTIPPTGEHHFESIVNDDYLIEDSDDPCVKPALYWKSCVNYVDENGTICGASAEEAHTQALEKLYEELNQRKDQGEEHTDAEWQKITEDAVKEIDAKYTFTVGGEGHSWVSYERQEATCTDNGWEAYRQCSVCGVIDGEYPVIPAKGHRWGEFAVVIEPTCTEEGRRERECEVCGEKESESIPAKGHSWGEYAVITAPTCTGEGVKEHTCTVCGATETASIPALGHTWGAYVVTKEPTCTEDGEQTRTCTVCGATETASVPALGHRFGAYVVTKEPTCTADGEQTRTCTVCGATETAPVPALGHRFGAYVVTKEPTCTVDGEQTRTCAACGEKETEIIPACHKWGEYIVTVEPGCYSSGERERTCTACGAKEKEAIAPAHKFGEWVVTMEPTCYSTGEEVSTCSVCGATESRWLDKAHKYVDGVCVFCGEADPSAAPAVSSEEANTEPEENNTEENNTEENNTKENNTEENTGNIDGNETPANEPAAEEQPAADAPYEGIKNADAVKNGEVVDEAYVGNVLTVAVTPANHEYVYQWYRMTDEGPVEIPGAYDKSYRLTEEDLGSEVYCFVADEEMSDATTYAVAVLPADQDPNPAADEAKEQAAGDEAAAGEKPVSDKKPLPKVKQETSSDETIASFTKATGIAADPASIVAQNVTPLDENGEKLDNDAVAAAGGVTFEMPLPESYKSGDPIEIYHQNSETGEWELITNYTIIDGKVIIREQKNFSPFIVVDMEDAETFRAGGGPWTVFLDPNGGTRISLPQYVQGGPGDKYTLPAIGSVIRQDHTLMGWNTDKNGNGDFYEAGKADGYPFHDDETLYAQWDIRITYNPNGGTGGPMRSTPVSGENVTLTYNDNTSTVTGNQYTRAGYEYFGWNTAADGSGTSYEEKQTITAPKQDLVLYAQWAKNPLTVSFNANGGSGTMDDEPVNWGDTLPLETYVGKIAPPEGMRFKYWTVTNVDTGTHYVDTQVIPAYEFVDDTILYAQWEADNVVISYFKNSTTATGTMTPDTVPSHKAADIKELGFQNPGYEFLGWATSGAADAPVKYAKNVTQIPATDVVGNIDLYAVWKQQITVTFKANNDTSETDKTQSAAIGNPTKLTSLATLGFTAPENKEFAGWNKDAAPTDPSTNLSDEALYDFNASITLYAQWKPIQLQVTFNSNTGSGSMDPQTFNKGEAFTLNKNKKDDGTYYITKTDHDFTGWNTEKEPTTTKPGTAYPDGATVKATDAKNNITLYAQWKKVNFTVTFKPNTGSGVDKTQPIRTKEHSSFTLDANTYSKENNIFVEWNTQADGKGTSYADEQVIPASDFTDDLVLYAQWATAIVFDANGGEGVMDIQKVTLNEKNTININEFERDNYTFSNWNTEADGSGTDYADQGEIKPTTSITLYAQWVKTAFSVSYEKTEGGGTKMADTIIQKDDTGTTKDSTYTAPDVSQIFGHWAATAFKEDGTLASNPKDATGKPMPTKFSPGDVIKTYYETDTDPLNIVMSAVWRDKLQVMYIPGVGTGDVVKEDVPQGSKVNLPHVEDVGFEPRSGEIFKGWLIEGDTTLHKAGEPVVFDSAKTVTAQWAKKIKISFDPNGGSYESRKAQEIPQDTPSKLASISSIGYTRTNYIFLGWSDAFEDKAAKYNDGGTYSFSEDTTLYAIWQRMNPIIKVTYNPNGGSGTAITEEIDTRDPEQTVLTVKDKPDDFSKVKHVFIEWNTKSDGKGDVYTPGDEIPVADLEDNVTFYAQWKTAIIFDGNGATSGSMDPQVVVLKMKTTLANNAFSRTNYAFTGWNTEPDGSGTAYEDGAEITPTSSMTLYAQWTKTKYSITYNANGGSGTMKPDQKDVGKKGTVKQNEFNPPDGSYMFGEWNTEPDGSGTSYHPDDEIETTIGTFPDGTVGPLDIDLYAIWRIKVDVTFYPGAAEGTYKTLTMPMGSPVKLPKPSDSELKFDPYDGQTFAGWEIEGETGLYKAGDEYTFNAPTKVTAQWAKKIKVSFDPNGGTGTRKAQEIPQGVPTSLATMEKIDYSRSGYEFKGWYTTPNIDPDSPKLIPDGGTVTFTYDTELYAIWKKHVFTGEVTISGSSTGSAAHAFVGETLTAKVTGDKVFKNYAYQWLADGEEIPGATSDTYDVQAEDFGKEITVAVTALDAEATDKKIQLSKNSKTVTMEAENLVKDIVDNGRTESAYVVGVAKGMTYTFNSTDKSTGMPVDSHLVIKDGVTVFPFTIQGVYRFYDKDGGLVSTVEVRNWYQLSFDVTNHISTSSSSSTSKSSGSSSSGSSGSSSSGSGTVVMKNGNTQLTATSRIPDAVNPIIQGKGTNLWWVREGAETNITMIVKPASNSYASYSLNGSSYASIGSGEKTIKVSPITKSMHYEIAFYSTSASPKTADMSHIGMWSALCFTSLVGASAILTRSRRRRKNENWPL